MESDECCWVARLFEAIDARDLEGFSSFLEPEVMFRFGNSEPVRGRESTREVIAGVFSSVAGLRHRLDDIWQTDRNNYICRGEVPYTRLNGTELRVRFADVFELRDGRNIRFMWTRRNSVPERFNRARITHRCPE